MASKTLFYSWQSDLDKKQNNFFIKNCIEKAIKKLNRDIQFEISLDKDTQDNSGSPDIAETIFRKIRASDIFIADVTIINNNLLTRLSNGRKTPNPNVLIELGYAIKTLGKERVITIANLDFCRLEDLPFDVRNNRTTTYSIKRTGRKKGEEILVDILVTAIKSVLDDYSGILLRHQQDEYTGHDKGLFQKFDALCGQTELFESLDFACTTLSVNQNHYNLWRGVKSFSEEVENTFLNSEIQESFLAFVGLLAKMHLLVATKLFSEQTPGTKYLSDYTDQGIEITPEIRYEVGQTQWFKYPDGPYDNDWNGYHQRFHDTQEEFNRQTDKIMTAYKNFRLMVKKYLFI